MEFVEILTVFSFLYKYFFPITVAGKLFNAGVLLYLINREETPEFKLPWTFLMLVVPVMGAFAFVVLSSTENSRDLQKRHRASAAKLAPYLKRKDQTELLSEEADREARLQAAYLQRAAGMPCCGNTQITYYRTGQEFYQALLESLERAEQFIFMEYFIIESGSMWDPIYEVLQRKAAQGVEVCLMYDDIGCMGTLPSRYDRIVRRDGIRCMVSNRFRPVLSNVHNNRDHRKITVIDGNTGFTGGINLADEYINAVEKFGYWKDTAVKLEGDAVGSLTALFLSFWNTQCEKTEDTLDYGIYMETSEDTLDYGIYMETSEEKKTGEGAVIPFGDGPDLLYPESIGKNVYLNIIHTAREYLYITSPYLICDHEILNSLRLAAGKGVDVRIIVPHIPDKQIVFLMTQSNYPSLIQAGVKIYEYTPGFIHAKNFVCDDRFAVCGTINLDYRSLAHHYECGVWMYRTGCIGNMKEDFRKTLEASQEILLEQARLKLWKRLPAETLKLFTPLF